MISGLDDFSREEDTMVMTSFNGENKFSGVGDALDAPSSYYFYDVIDICENFIQNEMESYEFDVILDGFEEDQECFLGSNVMEHEFPFSLEKNQFSSHFSWDVSFNFEKESSFLDVEKIFPNVTGLKRKFDCIFGSDVVPRKLRRLNDAEKDQMNVEDDVRKNLFVAELEGFDNLLLNNKLDKITSALSYCTSIAIKMISKFNKYYKNKGDEMMKEETVNRTLIKLILSFLQDCDKIPFTEQIEYITILGLLSRSNLGSEYIISQGGVIIGANLIKKYHTVPDLFCSCLLAFGNIINTMKDRQSEITKIIEEENIVTLVLNAMKSYIHNTDLTQHACFALGNLAFIGFENLVLKNNGIEIVLEAMEQNLNTPSMLTEAIFLLKNLAFEENGRNNLMKNKVVEKIIPIISYYISNVELVELSINLIYDLSFAGSIEILQELDSFHIIFDVIKLHNNNTPVLKECLRTLSRAYCKTDLKGKIQILKTGAIDILIDTYNKNKENTELKQKMGETMKYFSNPITYSSKPPFLSLKEICSRQILNQKNRL